MAGRPPSLTAEQVREIRRLGVAHQGKSGTPGWKKQAARRFGVSPGHVGSIAYGRCYAWVPRA